MAEVHVYEAAPGRWAYRVGSVVQEWHPDKAGAVAMTEAEATELGGQVAERLAGEGAQPVNELTKLQFMARFTTDELVSVYAAARQSPMVEVWLDQVKLATGISLSDPRTIAGVHALEQAGLLVSGRAKDILRP